MQITSDASNLCRSVIENVNFKVAQTDTLSFLFMSIWGGCAGVLASKALYSASPLLSFCATTIFLTTNNIFLPLTKASYQENRVGYLIRLTLKISLFCSMLFCIRSISQTNSLVCSPDSLTEGLMAIHFISYACLQKLGKSLSVTQAFFKLKEKTQLRISNFKLEFRKMFPPIDEEFIYQQSNEWLEQLVEMRKKKCRTYSHHIWNLKSIIEKDPELKEASLVALKRTAHLMFLPKKRTYCRPPAKFLMDENVQILLEEAGQLDLQLHNFDSWTIWFEEFLLKNREFRLLFQAKLNQYQHDQNTLALVRSE